eukprot:1141463-Pelagomonas_calceolata.AAC.9
MPGLCSSLLGKHSLRSVLPKGSSLGMGRSKRHYFQDGKAPCVFVIICAGALAIICLQALKTEVLPSTWQAAAGTLTYKFEENK